MASTSGSNEPPSTNRGGHSKALSLDLSRIRHDLRTPINHILGFCEMLQEGDDVPADFQSDLNRIHTGGKQLLALIQEYFDESTFGEKRQDFHRLCHELRTPVNHIVGYSELLEEQAEDRGLSRLIPDLRKIGEAGRTWLGLMEEYLIRPVAESLAGMTEKAARDEPVALLQPGIDFSAPAPLSADTSRLVGGHLLIADDDAANREMLSRRLQRQGYAVTAASSGLDALRLMRAQRFDLLLLDMIMPGLDGYQVLTRIKADATMAHIPVVIMSSLDQENSVARCIEAGAEDYITKPFNPVLLRARIGACLERKRLRDQERAALEALQESQKVLSAELAEAAEYVRSLMPPPLREGAVCADWRFQPSTQLGGDAFGYHWLNTREFAFYVLDVCGHGVGAALLSVSVMNVLKNQSMPNVDFADPAAVLAALNRTFAMEKQNNMFFTIWYGVLSPETRALRFACGGHPPAVLLYGGSAPQPLRAQGAIIGGFPEATYDTGRMQLSPGARIYVFSDGVYELERDNGSTATLEEFTCELGKRGASAKLDAIIHWAAGIRGGRKFEDDLSLLEISLD
jgi:sigma-B regulation protein RsbU (phosphoserine phosphatase)